MKKFVYLQPVSTSYIGYRDTKTVRQGDEQDCKVTVNHAVVKVGITSQLASMVVEMQR